jgi:hypothetical protein
MISRWVLPEMIKVKKILAIEASFIEDIYIFFRKCPFIGK